MTKAHFIEYRFHGFVNGKFRSWTVTEQEAPLFITRVFREWVLAGWFPENEKTADIAKQFLKPTQRMKHFFNKQRALLSIDADDNLEFAEIVRFTLTMTPGEQNTDAVVQDTLTYASFLPESVDFQLIVTDNVNVVMRPDMPSDELFARIMEVKSRAARYAAANIMVHTPDIEELEFEYRERLQRTGFGKIALDILRKIFRKLLWGGRMPKRREYNRDSGPILNNIVGMEPGEISKTLKPLEKISESAPRQDQETAKIEAKASAVKKVAPITPAEAAETEVVLHAVRTLGDDTSSDRLMTRSLELELALRFAHDILKPSPSAPEPRATILRIDQYLQNKAG